MEKVSIIIPIYNVKKYIERCIKSLICQTYGNIDILLVNDGSTDDSKCICEQRENVDYKFIFRNAKKLKTKIKVLIFFISKKLYIKLKARF